MIMSVLDTKSNRVTLKMDVSHTEHSHVIGKGGNNIKKVMEETGCHIHFPDSNRNNQAEKSNQVSIAGQPAGVESARVRIRELLPLVLMFELPIAGILQPVPDPNSPSIQHISQTYNISVSFKQRSRVYGATVIVRGSQNNTSAVKASEREGTAMLLEHLAGSLASAIPVSTQLDIAAQHHLFMMGRNGSNIKHIMQRTGAQIHFPDPSNPQKKSTVYLQGTIESVCLARQYLMGCLPLVLMFDMKEEIEVDPQFIAQLMEQLDVFISIKPKPKQPSKNYDHICMLFFLLLFQSPNIKYGAISTSPLGEKVLSANHGDPSRPTTGSEQVSPKSNPAEGCNDAFVEVGMPRSPSHSGNAGDLKQMMGPSKVSCAKRQTVELLQGTKNSHLHSTDRLLSDPELSAAESPLADKKAPGSERAAERAAAAQQNNERARLAPRPSYVNMQAFDYEQKKLLATKAMLKKPVVTEVRTPTNTWSGLGFSKSMPAETIKELRRANHVSYKPTMTTTFEGSSMSLSRSNSREHLGSGSESDNWRDRNGIGPTRHSEFAASIGSPKRKQNKSTEHYLSSSNYMDCISSLTGSNGCNLNSSFKGSDLPELFSKLGLGKYTDVFQQQEIDLQTFLTLTDQDLKELGITTFGARRKMLLAISVCDSVQIRTKILRAARIV
ncbi:Protein bicaudal C-like protein 1 [Camelus dromedarius]|uniref:Protein bicaudal C-like protein 1 n=1 Tax=Camelus dromedarius TaxID=9838 RepID=A0A5N4DK95_CAMDR|nr:Protein bicaudal C-like protein 1 [Camelus dromedarius]